MAFLEVAVRQDTAQPGVGPREPHARCGPAYPQEPGDLGGWPFFFELPSDREPLPMLLPEPREPSRPPKGARVLAPSPPRRPLARPAQVSPDPRRPLLLLARHPRK